VTKKDIAGEIARRTGLTQVDVTIVFERLLENIVKTLVDGRRIEIRGFGRFKVVERKARMARNPMSGAAVEVAAGVKAKFVASRELMGKVNGGKQY